jgi:2-pyrone-4,6-dicarboxylate lactonase
MAPMARSSATGAERWDCHVHLFGPTARFPYAAKRRYTPRDALPEDLSALMQRLGVQRSVIVQASVYGDDHRCMLAALGSMGGAALGVAALVDELDKALSLRKDVVGLRLNLRGLDFEEAKRRIAAGAKAAADNGWHIELHLHGPWLSALGLENLPVDFVLDHMGRLEDGMEDSFEPLSRLLDTGRCWVKLSGADRVGPHAPAVARRLLAARPDRLVWGSDWPHVPLEGGPDAPREVDTPALLAALREWTAGGEALERVLAANPARLYGRGAC